jgi:hypothetical protein
MLLIGNLFPREVIVSCALAKWSLSRAQASGPGMEGKSRRVSITTI